MKFLSLIFVIPIRSIQVSLAKLHNEAIPRFIIKESHVLCVMCIFIWCFHIVRLFNVRKSAIFQKVRDSCFHFPKLSTFLHLKQETVIKDTL